jgi:predicted sugar kinase
MNDEGTGAVTVTVARTGGLVCDGGADKVKLAELVVEMAGLR